MNELRLLADSEIADLVNDIQSTTGWQYLEITTNTI